MIWLLIFGFCLYNRARFLIHDNFYEVLAICVVFKV